MRKKIGEKIRYLRTENKINQKELIQILGISHASLSAYENGNKLPSLDVLIKITQYFNVSLDWLCGLEKQTPFCTGADFINFFLKIKELPGFNYDINAKVISGINGMVYEQYTLSLTFTGEEEAQLRLEPKEIFDVNTFSEFMIDYNELEKKLKTLNDKELSQNYKKMWLEKKLQEYSNYKIIGEQ